MGTAVDIDGNSYSTIIIGTQEWMVENLKTTKYNDGSSITNVTDNATWAALTTEAYCWYDNDAATYKATYGALYNWYVINTGKLAPSGWRVPTKTDFETLETFLGGSGSAGGKLKESGTSHWTTPNTGATNSSGFTGLGSGYRHYSGIYNYFGTYSNFWSSTIDDSEYSWIMQLYYTNDDSVITNYYVNQNGLTVRCVKDAFNPDFSGTPISGSEPLTTIFTDLSVA